MRCWSSSMSPRQQGHHLSSSCNNTKTSYTAAYNFSTLQHTIFQPHSQTLHNRQTTFIMAVTINWLCPGCHQPLAYIVPSKPSSTSQPHKAYKASESSDTTSENMSQDMVIPQHQWSTHQCGRNGCLFNPITAGNTDAKLTKQVKQNDAKK